MTEVPIPPPVHSPVHAFLLQVLESKPAKEEKPELRVMANGESFWLGNFEIRYGGLASLDGDLPRYFFPWEAIGAVEVLW